MTVSRGARWTLGALMLLGLAFVWVPITVVVINSFNASPSFSWPPKGFTTRWWEAAWSNQGAREAVWQSVQVATIATVISIVLGSLLALALGRTSFFGRQAISLLVILPIALPGIVTALALRTGFREFLGVDLSFWTLTVAHATFCMVVMYNNVLARIRRLGSSLEEASMDLGGGVWTTFWRVTFPMIRSSLLAGVVLAFALSFDEIVVTLFTVPAQITTLPVWIFQNLFRPNQAPIVNVVAAVLIMVSIVPIYLSQRLSSDTGHGGGRL